MQSDDPWQRFYKAKALLKADLLPFGDDQQDARQWVVGVDLAARKDSTGRMLLQRVEGDMAIGGKPSDRRNRVETAIAKSKSRTCPDCGQTLTWGHRCLPLVVLGQGASQRVYNGEDFGVTNLPSSLTEAARRLGGALLSFFGARR